MSPVMKRIAILGLMALTLGACDFGLLMAPDPADPGDTVTVTNSPDGPTCIDEPAVPGSAQAAAGMPVGIIVVTSLADLEGGPPDDITVVDSDDEGFFTAEITAPDIPGQHLVVAICGFSDVPPGGVLEDAAAAAEPVDEDGVIIDTLVVGQQPLTIALSDESVVPGDEVIATFNRCKDENDFDQFEEIDAGSAADPTPEELATDFPDLDVFLDDELVTTIAGTERYPTGTVDVPLTLDEVGEHEVRGVCTYQTFDFDFEAFIEMIEGGGETPLLGGANAAAITYPFPAEGDEEAEIVQWNEATTEAAATVTVATVDDTVVPAPAEPAPVQPTFTG